MMLFGPLSEIKLSVKVKLATPLEFAPMLPRSPIWRSWPMGPPWRVCEETRHGDIINRSASAYCCKLERKFQNKAT